MLCCSDEIVQDDCNLDEDEAGLTWDAICFVFLLFQLRIYKSQYFLHVVTELEIQNKLSARSVLPARGQSLSLRSRTNCQSGQLSCTWSLNYPN